MLNQNFSQLQLPIIPQKIDIFKKLENEIQEMLDITWEGVLAHISMRTTQALMSEHGKLIALHNGEALIRISSLPLYKIAQTKLPEIEAGFQKAFGVSVKVRLEV
jgi:hypothetical protein